MERLKGYGAIVAILFIVASIAGYSLLTTKTKHGNSLKSAVTGMFLGVDSESKNKDDDKKNKKDKDKKDKDKNKDENDDDTILESTTNSTGIMTLEEKLDLRAPTSITIDTNKSYTAILTTTKGNITISLNANSTPITVNNFVYLSKLGFYNDVTFHRVIQDFVIQGGDPLGAGYGGPAYRFEDEAFTGSYTRGTVAMANSGKNTNGSQFFIVLKDLPNMPKVYTIFGHVTAGMDVVDTIASAPTKPAGEGSEPVNPTTITSVEIVVQ